MKTQQVFALGALIITVCLISLIPFSNVEGNTTYNDYYESLNNSVIQQENAIKDYANKQTAKIKGNTSSSGGSVFDIFSPNYHVVIKTNSDFMNAVNNALSSNPNPATDKVAIYNLQSGISALTTQNAATLVGEIGNPNNINNPRLFLQYMNWFCSNCPVDSDSCPGLR